MHIRTYGILVSFLPFIALSGVLNLQCGTVELLEWLNLSMIFLVLAILVTLTAKRMNLAPEIPEFLLMSPPFKLATAVICGWFPALMACYAVFSLLYLHARSGDVAWILCILAGNVGEWLAEAYSARKR